MSQRITTPEFRVSFPQVFTARAVQAGQEPKFSIAMLFPEGTDLTALKKAAEAAVREKFGDKPPKSLRSPFRDADEFEYAGYEAGVTVVRASSKQKPGLVDARLNIITEDEDEFYAGCYARATIRAFAYDTSGNRGVSFGLDNIQKLRDGERLGGRPAATADFEAVGTESTEGIFE